METERKLEIIDAQRKYGNERIWVIRSRNVICGQWMINKLDDEGIEGVKNDMDNMFFEEMKHYPTLGEKYEMEIYRMYRWKFETLREHDGC